MQFYLDVCRTVPQSEEKNKKTKIKCRDESIRRPFSTDFRPYGCCPLVWMRQDGLWSWRQRRAESWHEESRLPAVVEGQGSFSAVHLQAGAKSSTSPSSFISPSPHVLVLISWHKRASWGLHKPQRRWCKGSPGKSAPPEFRSPSRKTFSVRQQEEGFHTYKTHQHDEERQLEVLHTHGPGEVSTRGLECDGLAEQN